MEGKKCTQCGDRFSDEDRYVECSSCASLYHLGQECSGVAEGTFSAMSAKRRDKWRCKTCRSGDASQGGSSQLTAIAEKLSLLDSTREQVDALSLIPSKIDELLCLKSEIEAVNTKMQEIHDSVEFLSSKYDSLLQEAATRDKNISALSSRAAILEDQVASQEATIQSLRSEMNASEQYSRSSNLEIHGLPQNPGENLTATVSGLAAQLGIDAFLPGHVVSVHRLPGKGRKPAPVLVRFLSAGIRDSWLAGRKKLRHLAQGKEPFIFFVENLTKYNRELFWATKSKAKEVDFKFVWVKHGRIYARKKEGDPILRITSLSDLSQLA